MNKQSFVMYESFFAQAERLEKALGKEVAYDFMKAICEFGLYGVLPADEDVVWLYGLEQSIASISAAKTRYEASKENGKKGGRKPIEISEAEAIELKKELGTWKKVAEHLGVTDQTLRNKRKEWENQKNQKNLNDNVNVNENINENEKENETIVISAFGENQKPEASPARELSERAKALGF